MSAEQPPASETVPMMVQVYRSSKVADMYLLLPKDADPSTLPEALLTRFGAPQPAFSFALTSDRRLARIEPARLRAALDDPGYYLQLPPNPDHWHQRGQPDAVFGSLRTDRDTD